MSFKQIKFACQTQAVAVAAILAVQFFALHSDNARAQMSAQGLSAQGSATQTAVAQTLPVSPVAAPSAAPPAIPAVAGSSAAAKPIVGTAPATPATCTAPTALARFDRPLIHTSGAWPTASRLPSSRSDRPLTAGAGASSPDASYPSRRAVQLRARFPGREITVLNRGVNGEEAIV